MPEKIYWVYLLNCVNGSYYTGYTTDLIRRYHEHRTGSDKCKYTRSFKPLGVVQCWAISGTQSMAMKIEKFIKGLSRREKEELILRPECLFVWYDSCDETLKDYV